MVMHDFDAGDLGCADGLARVFIERIGAINVGDALRVTTTDPAARVDLPALARLRGHRVQSTDTLGDGRTQVVIERLK